MNRSESSIKTKCFRLGLNKDRFWSPEEEKILEENYLIMRNIELGDKLNRSVNSIHSKIQKLNLHRPKEIISKFIRTGEAKKKQSEKTKGKPKPNLSIIKKRQY